MFRCMARMPPIWFFDPLWNHNVLLKKNHIMYHIFTCYYALMTIKWWFTICALIEIWWMTVKIIGTYTTSSLVHHFKSIPKWPIWVKFDDFFSRVTLKLDDWPWKTIGHLSLVTSISGYSKLFEDLIYLCIILFMFYTICYSGFIHLFFLFLYLLMYTYLFIIHLISSVNVYFTLLNSLWPSNTIWWHGTG